MDALIALMSTVNSMDIPGLNHMQAYFRIKLVLPNITIFLEELNPG
jgi:hypothetical protein